MMKLRPLLAAFLLPFVLAWSIPAAAAGSLVQKQIAVNGTTRTYLLYVPTYIATLPDVPLVLVFHAQGTGPTYMAGTTAMHEIAEREGFIVAYPAGIQKSWNAGDDQPANYAEKNGIDDVGFVRTLVADLQRRYRIDSNRIFAAGLSNGGSFSYSLACDTAHFAAVASVASQMVDATCRPPARVSVLHVHGTDDQVNPWQGGENMAGRMLPPVGSVLDFWARHDGCRLPRVGSATGFSWYNGCANGRHVEFHLVQGGRHQWDQPGPDTSELVWDFFFANARAAGS
jgi:polyhydroxybutyrate depolymerase